MVTLAWGVVYLEVLDGRAVLVVRVARPRHPGWFDAASACDPIATGSVDVGRRDPFHNPNGSRRESSSTTMFEPTTPIALSGSTSGIS